jgi:7-keto-8-aminopelargonate synthetase-like enzyme
MGGGQGSAHHFGVTSEIDFIMGTFSKAFGSIGGFIASDHEDIITYLKHHSKSLIFSAALPAANVAAVLASLDVLENNPGRLKRLHKIADRVREGYKAIGLRFRNSETPIIPIYIGSEEKAARFSLDLFENGVFALPVVYPAVPKGQEGIRTAFMSTHEDHHIDFVLEVLDRLARKHRIRISDLESEDDCSKVTNMPFEPDRAMAQFSQSAKFAPDIQGHSGKNS